MPARIRSRLRAPFFAAAAFGFASIGATCDRFIPLERTTVLGRLGETTALVGAYELGAACDLQLSESEEPPEREGDWRGVARNELFRRELTIEARAPHTARLNFKDIVYATLYVRDTRTGKRVWLRSTPSETAATSQDKWKCLVGVEEAAAAMPRLSAPRVALATGAPECVDVSPIFGGKGDVGFDPYAPNQRTLVVTAAGKVYVAVRLERAGGDGALTVPAQVLDRCFVAVAPEPTAAREPSASDAKPTTVKAPDADAFFTWLDGASPETTPPPPVRDDLLARMTGVDPATCPKWGPSAMPTYACRVPAVKLVTLAEAGPFGPPRVRLVRERRVDALYVRAGKLIAPADAPAVNMVVRAKASPTPGFARALAAELGKPDPERLRRRLLSGARLLRASDVTKASPATHAIDVELAYSMPPVEIETDVWTHRYVAGKIDTPNPRRAEAEAAVFDAKAAVASADLEVVMAERLGADATVNCGKSGETAATNPTCGGAQDAWPAAAIAARKGAQARLKDAEARLASTPSTVAVDDERTFDLSTKVARRRGDAVFHVTVTSEGRGANVELDTSSAFTFDVVDPELPSDPAHKIDAKSARPPTTDEVDKKVASLFMTRLEELLMKWQANAQTRGDVGDVAPGTRSWMTEVARQATNGRDVKLLGDLQERRADVLALESIPYGVTIAEDAPKGCFTFAASAQSKGDINLTFARKSPSGLLPLASDRRASPDAALEVCNLVPAEYTVTVSLGRASAPRHVLILSMFASTPGRITNAETVAATRGLPFVTTAGETLSFSASGLSRVAEGGARASVSASGDRDGDGIPDEVDRCPALPETKNGHLDQDGCPDDVPPANVVEGGEL